MRSSSWEMQFGLGVIGAAIGAYDLTFSPPNYSAGVLLFVGLLAAATALAERSKSK